MDRPSLNSAKSANSGKVSSQHDEETKYGNNDDGSKKRYRRRTKAIVVPTKDNQ